MIFVSAHKPAGTKTGRLAASKLLGEFGANAQNQADEVRRLFIPRPGYRFIQNDLEGAEAVAVALLCTEGNFRELVRRKVKIHNFVCVKIFSDKFHQFFNQQEIDNLTPAGFHEHPRYKDIVKHCKSLHTEYDLAKRTVHGCLTDRHEVFTPIGWVPIADAVADPTLAIAVVDGDDPENITFEIPAARIHNPKYKGQLYMLSSRDGLQMEVTVDHAVALIGPWGALYKVPPHYVQHMSYRVWPTYKHTAMRPLDTMLLATHSYPVEDLHVYCFTTSTGYFLCRDAVTKVQFATGNSNYSMGWKTFQENILKETDGRVALSAAECKRLLNSYFTLFPEVKVFQSYADEAVKEFLPLQNLFGWEIKIVQRYTTALGRTAVAWRPQSTVGIAGILGAHRLQRYVEEHGRQWNVLTITHDSNLTEAPIQEAEECAQISADCLSFEFTSPIDGWKCRIGVEKSIGDNWGKYDEKENPLGLRVIQ